METPRKSYVPGHAAAGLGQLARRFVQLWTPKWRSRYCPESEIREELQAHIDIEIHEQLAAGRSPQEAERAARLAFGNTAMTQEDLREIWRPGTVDRFLQDFRLGIRMLCKSLGWTIV